MNRSVGTPRISRRQLVQGSAGLTLLRPAPHRASPLRQPAATLTLATNRTPTDLDPHSAYDAGSGVALQGPYEGLIRLKAGTTDAYEPLLAESWSANADNSVWTFRIRAGATFHDGTPLTADAARLSFERLFSLGLAPSTVLGRFIASADQLSAPDSRTLIFDLGRPQPFFEAAMASSYGTAIVNAAALRSREAAGDWGHGWAQTTSEGLGTGPYRVVQYDVESGVVLQRFDDYWRGWAGEHFDRIVIRVVAEPETRRQLIENGGADLATTLPYTTVRDLEANPLLVVDRRYNLSVTYIAMTVAGPFQSASARQALCWAFPYDDVIEGVYEGFARRAIGPMAELCRGFDPDTFVYQTDLERARTLWHDAGLAEGPALTILLPASNLEAKAIAELLQANLAAIGVRLDIQLTDFATYVGIVLGDAPADERPNLLPSFWQPDYNDGWNHLWPQLSCDAWTFGNLGHYCNEQVDSLLDRARTAADASSYQAALSDVQQLVTYEDPAAIYMAQPQWLTVLRRDVGGFTPNQIVGEIVDFYALFRRAASAAGDHARFT